MEVANTGVWLYSLLIGIGVLLANLCILGVVGWYLQRKVNQLRNLITEFVTPVDENTPAPTYQLAEKFADLLAAKVAIHAKMTLMSYASADAKRDKALDGALATDVMANQGGLMGILAGLPQVQKLIKSNPNVALNLASRLAGSFSPGNSSARPGNNDSMKIV